MQREYNVKAPTDEYAANIQQSMPHESFDWETGITEAVTEMIPMKEEEAKDLTMEIKAEVMGKEIFQQNISTDIIPTTKATDKTIKDSKAVKEEITETKEILKDSTKGETELSKCPRVDDVLKEWTETYLAKIKPPSEEYKRHMEKTTEKHDKPSKSTIAPSDTCALKIKKDDLQSVDLSARYAITVLDQVVKKEIAEVKESLEAAKQDLIEELSENSQTVIQI
ncbi:PREDICTED: uncharacterized protein LOC105461902, partial [Wasmannia auropunctata]|uniref:uncharacterized protein LOC105461902 n=1 Tax=Wasmannia auropunctata TaxID=64793 RepID=UPI0005EF8C74